VNRAATASPNETTRTSTECEQAAKMKGPMTLLEPKAAVSRGIMFSVE
jgi:hypothetical protein